ncbi:hypothetical protein H5410_055678 [Solanum commersonii]|uniref:Uncharacterized protein n=1 Tax=Solanum commersonii TaxID=4109 RepID=A0A9J5WKI7_SOLCO|nr:hypothetical protein H5410_055678 [Solanum commersonii]
MLIDTYPLTTLYDILEELVSAASETNEKGNSIIVLSSDIEVVASASKDTLIKPKPVDLPLLKLVLNLKQ